MLAGLCGAAVLSSVAPAVAAPEGDAASQPACGDEVTFRFAPPTGTKFSLTTETTDEQLAGAETRVSKSEIVSTGEIEATATGYEITQTVDSATGHRFGKPLSELEKVMLSSPPLTAVHDKAGALVEVRGFGAMLDQVKEHMEGQGMALPPALETIFNPDTLMRKAREEWEGRVSGLVGTTVRLCEKLESVSAFTLPSGEAMTFSQEIAFPRMEKCRFGSCVRVVQVYDADPEAVLSLVTSVLKDAVAAKKGDLKEFGGTEFEANGISGYATRLIDPATMLIVEETSVQVVRMAAQGPDGKPLRTQRKRIRRWTYEYD